MCFLPWVTILFTIHCSLFIFHCSLYKILLIPEIPLGVIALKVPLCKCWRAVTG